MCIRDRDGRIRDEDAKDGTWEKQQHRSGEQAPSQHDAHRQGETRFDPTGIAGTVILSGKGVEGRRKTLCAHPGDRFDLGTDLLHGDGSIAPYGDHACDHHGDAGKQHAL